MQSKESSVCCSFCDQSQDQGTDLIAAANAVICHQCVQVCNEIVSDLLMNNSVNDIGDNSDLIFQDKNTFVNSAVSEVNAARILFENGYYRMSVIVLRESVYSLLRAMNRSNSNNEPSHSTKSLLIEYIDSEGAVNRGSDQEVLDMLLLSSVPLSVGANNVQSLLQIVERMIEYVRIYKTV